MHVTTASTSRRVGVLWVQAIVSVALLFTLSGCNFPGIARVPPLPPGIEQRGGIASLESIMLNGSTQYIQIRAHHPDAPLPLYLTGGPSGSEMAWFRHYHPDLERHFVIIHWDQPGAAKSYAAADWDNITPEQYVEDAGELIGQLLNRFQRKCLLVVGNSRGSILGVRVAARWPDKLCSYVGATQQVNVIETDKVGSTQPNSLTMC